MRKLFLILSLILLPLFVSAQQFSFGYFSYDEVLHSMPEYAIAQHNLQDLRSKYDAETKRVEDEFNAKYEEFLDGQKDFAPSIMEKRQAELRDLLEKNIAFKEDTKRLLSKAEDDAYSPMKAKINSALQKIGKEKGFALIINIDINSTPYINPEMGTNITPSLLIEVK
nr:OmpH family outer membrane protein [Prevotella sp.]